jgi:alkanesulfonate monooxygenase SsuD/methylene tetrahydromethanopterin reductase-like flavin-dependent oxidoreductase (luciferase family)
VIDVPLSVLDLSPVAAGTSAGRPQPLATPQEAAAYPYSGLDREMARQRFADQAIGSPDTVRRQLAGLLERTAADELMVTAQVYDIDDRTRSLELMAEKVAGGLRRPES